ncbi:MAG: HTTM domain-containing protein [Saprospiraceae bacterium]
MNLSQLSKPSSIAPLVTFRITFGALMMIGAIRFLYNGWVDRLYIEPKFFFKFYGFEWVEVLSANGMYALLWTIIFSSAMVMLGLFYRFAIVVFFCSFTYLELIDATNYLNHYYLVVLLAFLMIFLPAHRNFSLDVWRKPTLKVSQVPRWVIVILMVQLTIVYTCAGLAKLNADWLFRAMPLAIWLPEHQDLPLVGPLLKYRETAFIFSWFGAIYDLLIAWFLWFRRTRWLAYVAVVVFHLMTNVLFNIGLFPAIMITSTLIFFSGHFHEKLLGVIGYKREEERVYAFREIGKQFLKPMLIVFFVIQLVLPFRYLFYSSHLTWAEEGYRFSWRVMLVEKIGQATFYVEDPDSGRKTEILNGRYLSRFQEKQMSIQPDFILQFAHFLKEEYQQKNGIKNPIVTVDAHVALNGRMSQRLIDPNVNLAEIKDTFAEKKWILPYEK